MLSEWFESVPDDFPSRWTAVPVPEGHRAFVLAGDGKTKAFSRHGKWQRTFPSFLPGGCRSGLRWKSAVAVLDCVFVPHERTFYCLDVMVWDGASVYGCDTEFRSFWLNGKVSYLVLQITL